MFRQHDAVTHIHGYLHEAFKFPALIQPGALKLLDFDISHYIVRTDQDTLNFEGNHPVVLENCDHKQQ